MKIIVGLGNIGKEFEKTYHNMGFLTIDKFAEKNDFSFTKNKCQASVAEGFYEGEKIVLAKPTTYMNASGVSIKQLIQKFGASLKDLLIIYDDIDLPVGSFRYRAHGSSGTHNGMRSCVEQLHSEEFARLRIGVGKPDEGLDLGNFVLQHIPDEKFKVLCQSIEQAQEKIIQFIQNKI